MSTIRWKDRLRYRFDNFMARGTGALIGGLALLSLVLVLLAALVVAVAELGPEGREPLSFAEAAWASLMRTLDPGTMGGDTGWGFRFVMFAVTLGGVFVISTLVGVLTTGIQAKMVDLRKGRSHVIERGHTVIIGWSPLIYAIISELVIANANQPKPCIVVLGDKDKVEMEEEIRHRVRATGHTRIVCRTGSPIDMHDLRIVSVQTCRSIIILSPGDKNADAEVIKTMLAITNAPDRRAEPYHIVAEMRDPKNLEVARLVGRGEVEIVMAGNLVARIIAQTCRQPGLSVVYTELLDFGGNEIYFKNEAALAGKTFGEALFAYEDSTVIGLRPADGQPRLNPPMETRLQAGDEIIVLSQDDSSIRLSGRASVAIDDSAIQSRQRALSAQERTLILGWNWRGPIVISELDQYVAAGSSVTILSDRAEVEADIARCCPELDKQEVVVRLGDTIDRRTLDRLDVQDYDHIIVLTYSDVLSKQEADSRTLMTLLHLRDIGVRCGRELTIVSEMLDGRNRELAEVTPADDFIVSDRLISLVLAQVAANKHLNAVLADIFDSEGSEIYMKPATDYVTPGKRTDFNTVVEAARRQGHVALGYRIKAQAGDPARSHGIVLNPKKAAPVTFSVEDSIVVLADE